MAEHRLQMDAVTNQNNQKRVIYMVKMLLVIVIPIATLVVLSMIGLYKAVNVQNDARLADDAISLVLQIDSVTSNLQVERGLSAAFLSSDGTNTETFNRILNVRKKADQSIMALKKWQKVSMDDQQASYQTVLLSSKEEFFEKLNDYRLTVNEVSFNGMTLEVGYNAIIIVNV